MPAGYTEEEARRRAREEELRQSGAGGNSRGYRGDQSPGQYTGYDYGAVSSEPDISEHDANAEGIPIYGWLSGADARASAARTEAESERNRNLLLGLAQSAPTAEELTPEYYSEAMDDEAGSLLTGPSRLEGMTPTEQRAALGQIGRAQSALGELMRGGMTAADRQALTASRLAEGARLRGANEAAIQQAGARGMGGGGAELAARLAGSQAYANANAMQDASILGQSQNRALQAMQGYGALGQAYGAIGGQMYGQEMQRRSALDAHNQQNVDWRRGRETRNTAWANAQQDARTRARETAYGMQERAISAAAGKNPWGSASEDRARQDQANQAGTNLVGTVLSEIL